MNIAMVCDPIRKAVGGSFISALRFGELLSKKGHKVVFIAAKYPDTPNFEYYKKIKVYRFFGVALPKSEKKMYLSFPTQAEMIKIFKKEKIDLVHVMLPTPSSINALFAARKLGLKVVAHSHTQPENIFKNLPGILNQKKLYDLFCAYMLQLYKRADVTICPTKFAEKLLKEYDKNINTVVISNGVDRRVFRKVPTEKFMKKFWLSKNDKYLLFVGRLHPEKNIETLIAAMPIILKSVPDAKLLIVGGGYLEEDLQSYAKIIGVDDKVVFMGKLSNEDLVKAYNVGNIFVLPSLAELEGMVVLEAMSCALPLLISDSKASASRYFVSDNGLLFKAGDPKNLAKNAIKILNDDVLRKNMAKKSLEYSREYDINKSIELLEETYAK